MLKLIYTETGLHLERLAVSLETIVTQRTILALRLGQSLYVETSRAAFLLPADLPEIASLEAALSQEQGDAIALCPVDDDYVEVSLRGVWVANDRQAEEGMFLSVVRDRSEFFIYKLWQLTQTKVSFFA